MPSFMARIYVNGEMINNDRNISWYSAPVKLKALGREVTQRIGLCIESKDNKMASNLINLSSQGVRVKTLSSQYGGANISFPGAVQVVEGRDEFKIDDNYKTSVNAVFSALEEYIRAENKENKITEHATNLIASLASAFALTTLRDLPNLNNLKELLIKDKKYVLTPVQFADLSPFLGPTLDRLAFKASDTSTAYWSQIYGRNVDIISDIMKPISSSDPFNFAFGISSKYPNLSLVAEEILKEIRIRGFRATNHTSYYSDKKEIDFYKVIHTVKVPEPGNEAFYLNGENHELYVNVAHPFIAGKREPNKLYATLFDYYGNSKILERHDLNNWKAEKDIRALALKLVEADSKVPQKKAPTYEYTPKIKLPGEQNATNT
ncbi:MAG: hypothetical protein A2328_10255 [Bdellovibrionales bacterium RIFOXYB2_FULL_36_6]|nr:MAG: hypothetical protein A2328_10255 [Bdellovibrionales bacterium RIFOXYB2_FULL_36_6]